MDVQLGSWIITMVNSPEAEVTPIAMVTSYEPWGCRSSRGYEAQDLEIASDGAGEGQPVDALISFRIGKQM